MRKSLKDKLNMSEPQRVIVHVFLIPSGCRQSFSWTHSSSVSVRQSQFIYTNHSSDLQLGTAADGSKGRSTKNTHRHTFRLLKLKHFPSCWLLQYILCVHCAEETYTLFLSQGLKISLLESCCFFFFFAQFLLVDSKKMSAKVSKFMKTNSL